MSKDKKTAAITQVKISQYAEKVSKSRSLPERKFVHDVLDF